MEIASEIWDVDGPKNLEMKVVRKAVDMEHPRHFNAIFASKAGLLSKLLLNLY